MSDDFKQQLEQKMESHRINKDYNNKNVINHNQIMDNNVNCNQFNNDLNNDNIINDNNIEDNNKNHKVNFNDNNINDNDIIDIKLNYNYSHGEILNNIDGNNKKQENISINIISDSNGINNNNIIINSEKSIKNEKLFMFLKEFSYDAIKEFISNPTNLKDEQLKNFFKQLRDVLKSGNNIIIPFLDLCPNLIKLYIDRKVDEEKVLEYIDIFKLLKLNSFINREYLYPIYEYFSDIYYDMNNIIENDTRLKKFNKVFELWKIFYDFNIIENELKDFNLSSYCFIGGDLKVNISENFNSDVYSLIIEINCFDNTNFAFNKDLIFLEYDNSFKIEYNQLKEIEKFNNMNKITFIILKNKINLQIEGKTKDNSIINKEFNFELNIDTKKEMNLLKNFFGQIKNIELIYKDTNNNNAIIINEIYEPYPINDLGYLYYKNKSKKQEDFEIIDNIGQNDHLVSLVITNNNFVKVNYINYLDKDFNLLGYYGGIVPFLPFIPLINGIYKNIKIDSINDTNKKPFLISIIYNILYSFLKIIQKYYKNFSKFINKYSLFIYYLIMSIHLDLIIRQKEKDLDAKVLNLYKDIIDLFNEIFKDNSNLINLLSTSIINSSSENEIECIFQGENEFLTQIIKENNDNNKIKYPLLIKSSYQQLFRHLMKELFIYNRFWSKKEIYFNNIYSKYKLKYKQLSYYTHNFQQPLLYPILEFDEYMPTFSRYDEKNMFKHKSEENVNYNFNLENNNIIVEKIKNINPLDKEKNRIRCCLIKKKYHIKGEIIIKEIKEEKKNNMKLFNIIFCADNGTNDETCNKNTVNTDKTIRNTIINCKNNQICYGSIFPYAKKEYNRKILIKSKDIKFILIRNYYRRFSAIEIFTFKSNKSYYFNFRETINFKNLNNINLLKVINDNKNFIKFKFNKNYPGGWYNKKYENTMFPLFSEQINEWKNKINFYNKYDLLITLNLLSNRSFKDIYQYPVFPILYKPIKIIGEKERDLHKHLGMQELNDKSISRKEITEETYNSSNISIDDEDENKQKYLFNTHYSNPVYVCNYLIRIFPYSIISIELQGDGFDSPNRIFYSTQRTFENTLAQKSDLRECIPEMYYLPEMFENKNQLNLGTIDEDEEIDNILFNDNENDNKEYSKYSFLEKFRNYLESNEIKINEWIDLIFGKDQKQDNQKRFYYKDEMYLDLSTKKQEKYLNNSLYMEKYEFGVQPIQLFDEKFPEIKTNSKILGELIDYYIKLFESEHYIYKENKKKCFRFRYHNEKEKIQNYINIINPNINKKKKNDSKDYKYIFLGDIFGDIHIYKKVKKLQNSESNKNNKKKNYNINNDFNKTMKKLTDHNKQIKYIDYNPRLNLFLSYSLDGFINIYTFPKCKLVRAIKVFNFTDSKEILEKVVLVSYPFPMIFTYDKNNMYTLTLNGVLINKKIINDKDMIISPCIDKNFGLVQDCIFMEKKNKQNKDKIIRFKISLPSLNKEEGKSMFSSYVILENE